MKRDTRMILKSQLALLSTFLFSYFYFFFLESSLTSVINRDIIKDSQLYYRIDISFILYHKKHDYNNTTITEYSLY